MANIPIFTYFIYYYIFKDKVIVHLNKNLRTTGFLENTLAINFATTLIATNVNVVLC